MGKKDLMVGWHPTAVNYDKWPGLTPERLEAALRSDEDKLNGLGFDTTLAFIHSSETAANDLTNILVKIFIPPNTLICIAIVNRSDIYRFPPVNAISGAVQD